MGNAGWRGSTEGGLFLGRSDKSSTLDPRNHPTRPSAVGNDPFGVIARRLRDEAGTLGTRMTWLRQRRYELRGPLNLATKLGQNVFCPCAA